MMIAVAVVALFCGLAAALWRRHVSLRRQAEEYAKKSNDEFLKGQRIDHLWFQSDPELRMRDEHYRLSDYYDELKAKYERAAARPWLPIESDRPPPAWPKDVPRVDDGASGD
jgi:hypothetical protein